LVQGAASLFSTPPKVNAESTFSSPVTDPGNVPKEQKSELASTLPHSSAPASLTPSVAEGELPPEDAPSVQTEIANDDDDEGMMDEIPLTPWTEQGKPKLDSLPSLTGSGQQVSASDVFGSAAGVVSTPPPFSKR
jgi:hypothetical protein